MCLEPRRHPACRAGGTAEASCATGPSDPIPKDPPVLRPQLLYASKKGLQLLCANLDIVGGVGKKTPIRGDVREWCAGAVAALYTEMAV